MLAEYRVRVLAPPGYPSNEVMDVVVELDEIEMDAALRDLKTAMFRLSVELRRAMATGARDGFDVVVEPVEDR